MSRWKLLVILLCNATTIGCFSAPPNIGGVKADRIVIMKSEHLMIMLDTQEVMKNPLGRRSFLKCALASGAALGMGGAAAHASGMPSGGAAAGSEDDARYITEARFYQKLANRKIKCKLCPRECTVGDKERGYCGVRENRGGVYYTLVHSRAAAAHVDPVEKKPLFHYLPGTTAFSLGTAGCNVNCKFCQNWELSQSRPEQIPAQYAPPRRVAELAAEYHCPTIAYTYNEPVIFAEYLMDTADAGHAAGIRSIVVSNGYIQDEALKAAYGKMDAVKIDLKSFADPFYHNVVSGQLKPVLETLVTLRKMGKWTEIVYLGAAHAQRQRRRISRPGEMDQDESGRGCAAAFHAVSSRVFAEESAHHAGLDAGTRQGDCRRRGTALCLHWQCSGASGAKYVLSQVPQDARRARGIHGQQGFDPQE
jgi:AmmeMemoRadiSam system radical SAM enzyme